VRRISCFSAADFGQPQATINEYCWEHGRLQSNSTSEHWTTSWPSIFNQVDPDWVLQAYVYFILRFFVFALPHIYWNLNFRASIQSIIKSCVDILKELEVQWLQYAEKAEGANHPKEVQAAANQLRALTRDIVQITRHQLPFYRRILTFVQCRMVLDIIFLTVFVVLDFVLFRIVSRYNSTDLYCPLPNEESVRCVIPMMQLLWQVVVLSLLASCFCLLMCVAHSIHLLHFICSKDTKDCFLDQIPYAGVCEDLRMKKVGERKTYKLLSKFLLLNYCVIQPLHFIQSFVRHLEENHQVKVGNGEKKETGEGSEWERLASTDI
jgi:hypothetical protein